jgi:sulfur dioxygenase
MIFRQLFDPASSTYTYLLADEQSREAVIIDPVIDQLERDVQLIQELDLKLLYVLDTHVHADHVTASGSLSARLGAKTVLSERSGVGYADRLVKDGDRITLRRATTSRCARRRGTPTAASPSSRTISRWPSPATRC